ncbi:MAG: GC-type dockerin domain-anchored protein [Phycisphaerales bacterium]
MQPTTTHRLLTATTSLLIAASAFAQDPFAYEGFQYGSTPNMQFANGGVGWSSKWNKLSSIPTGVVGPGLTWPGLVTNGNCAITPGYPSADFTLYTRALAPYAAMNDTIYVSFLMEPEAGFGQGGGLSFTATPQIIVGASLGKSLYGLTIPFVSSNNSNVPVVQFETALLVTRIVANGDGTATYSLFVNPTMGQPQPVTPSCEMTIAGGLPPIVTLVNDGGFATDEIRFGPTWSSVLPSTIPPSCPADLDGNGTVDGADLGMLLANWGAAASAADLNGDGAVDGADLGVLLASWGPC